MAKSDKNILIEKIKSLEGLSNDEKAQLIGYIKTKTYGLVWEKSTENVWEQLKDYIPVLVEVKDKEINNDTEELKNPNHILIEGDNLLALTALCYTHERKVDVIYIDPPYNTQNKDFKYNDTFVNPDDDYVHSQWLSFMSKRLMMSKRLLKEEGVLFISIDDREQANLKLLCDEIFGAKNFVAQMIWQQGKKHIGSFIGINHEYMLVYAKNKAYINDNNNKWKTKKQGLEKIYHEYNLLKRKYGDDFRSIQDGMAAFYRSLADSDPAKEHKHYSRVDERGLFFADNISQGTGNGPRYDVLHPITHLPVKKPTGGWRYSEDTMKRLLEEDRVFFGPDESTVPCRKRYLTETEYELPSSVFYKDGRAATKEVETIIGQKGIFNNPKDREIIQNVLNFKNNQIIVDFFAGSGTTLHATMQLNALDGGHRQCILVTNNENNICENVTYERNKRVINGYTKPNLETVIGLKNNNLRYYKVGFVPRDKDIANVERFARQSVNSLCIKEDVYKEQTMFGGLESKGFRYFKDGNKQFLVILDPEVIEPIIEKLSGMDIEGRLPIYVFTTGQYPYTEDFWEVSEKVELYPYPTCVYGACEKVMPKIVDKLIDQPEDIELTEEEANMTFDDFNKE